MNKIIKILKLFIKIPFFIIFMILFGFSKSSKEYKNYINKVKKEKEWQLCKGNLNDEFISAEEYWKIKLNGD
ncbi:hypothetical protein LCGC14_1163950 [marine sediment metagenome]|uniref:Uncharacterized protein n=1 Tax=marine sediment metagenome TaxID=412755 RepID=A0A0F9LRS7_9ZZZZ